MVLSTNLGKRKKQKNEKNSTLLYKESVLFFFAAPAWSTLTKNAYFDMIKDKLLYFENGRNRSLFKTEREVN